MNDKNQKQEDIVVKRQTFLMLASYANYFRILAIGDLLIGMFLFLSQIVHFENFIVAIIIAVLVVVSVILFLVMAELLDWMIQIEKENYQMIKTMTELSEVNQEMLKLLKLKSKYSE